MYEPAEVWVIVSSVEVEEAGGGIVSFADEGVFVGDGLSGEVGGVWVTEGGVGGGLFGGAVRAGDQLYRRQVVAVEVAYSLGDLTGIRNPEVRMRLA